MVAAETFSSSSSRVFLAARRGVAVHVVPRTAAGAGGPESALVTRAVVGSASPKARLRASMSPRAGAVAGLPVATRARRPETQ